MSSKYLVIPRIGFRGANAQPAWWCAAAPGPMAYCGFAHALGRVLEKPSAVHGVGIVLHDFQLRAERPGKGGWLIHPHQHRAAAFINNEDYSQGSKTLSSQPTIRGDGVVTVVIALDEVAAVSPRAVVDFLDRARIAGGTIHEHRYDASRGHVLHDWADVQRQAGGGFTFVDRANLMVCEGDEDPLDALLRATRRIKDEQPQHGGWLTPYLAGFRALTPVAARRWTRDGYLHAFAEPLVGLGQLVPARNNPIVLWSYAPAADGVFTVRPLESATAAAACLA